MPPPTRQTSRFPREVFRTLGRAGLLGLPYPEEYGGGGQPYEVYLQVVEELATVWAPSPRAVSVHTLACFPLAAYGTDEQRERWLPDMLGGELLGAYCLSEPRVRLRRRRADAPAPCATATTTSSTAPRPGSPTAARPTSTTCSCRTSDDGRRGHLLPAGPGRHAGLSAAAPERKMGFTASTTAQIALRRRAGRRPTG